MSKETILEEFDKTILEPLDKKDWGICPSQILAIKQFISDIIAQTREETIREVEELITGAWCVELSSDDLIRLINKLIK